MRPAITPFKESIYHTILKDDFALIRDDVRDLPAHFSESLAFLQSIPAPKLTHAYAPGKWTIAELIGYISDTQTVFLNRILYIARGEPVPLPNFDEQIWVRNGGA